MTWSPTPAARSRVIIDNDFSGDPDDLFALVHQVLSPSTSVSGVIGSHLAAGDLFDPSATQADNAARIATELLALVGRRDIAVASGSNDALDLKRSSQNVTAATELILAEAHREDSDLPLILTAGGGLTEIARAWLVDPTIEERMSLIWIGGSEYSEADAPPGSTGAEYNMNIDIAAAQVVFNESAIPIVQVPRDAYRQCIVSLAELEPALAAAGAVGDYLGSALDKVIADNERGGHPMGETWVMGDNPLVLLSALQTPWQPHFSSTEIVIRSTPYITDDGGYVERAVRAPRPIQVCRRLDTRLMTADMMAKLSRSLQGSDASRFERALEGAS